MVVTLRAVTDRPVCAKWEEGIIVEEGSSLTFPLVAIGSPDLLLLFLPLCVFSFLILSANKGQVSDWVSSEVRANRLVSSF